MTRTTDTTIPGLTVSWYGHSNLYARVVHKSSNLVALNFNNAPLPFGKREFVRRLDASAMTTVDWTVPVEQLTDPKLYELAMKVRRQILGN